MPDWQWETAAGSDDSVKEVIVENFILCLGEVSTFAKCYDETQPSKQPVAFLREGRPLSI